MMEVELDIKKVIFGGDGLAWHDEKTCLVAGALAGERVRAKVIDHTKKILRAEILEVLKPSPMRQMPPCVYVSHCGGCQYQHVDYASELILKQEQIIEAFEFGFKDFGVSVGDIKACSSEHRYRNQVALHMHHTGKPQSKRIGFLGKDNVTPVIIDDCLLVREELKRVFTDKHILKKGHTHIQYRLDENQLIISSEKAMFLRIRVGDDLLWAASTGFFQNNLEMTANIVRYLTEWLSKDTNGSLMDLYCGSGIFSILAADKKQEILYFEANPSNLDCLRLNLRASNVQNYEVFAGPVEKRLPTYLKGHHSKSFSALIDPPRQGLATQTRDTLIQNRNITRLFYLSCNLSTLIRDLKDLVSQGDFCIDNIQPFDMFPRTKHIEIAVTLSRKSNPQISQVKSSIN